jgi:signal peptidase I
MKRALSLIVIIVAAVVGFLSIRGAMPFLPVFGTSMEPVLKAGNLIFIESVSPSDVKVGDIIVFSVNPLVRETYNYPPVVAHRVKEVFVRDGVPIFRTKGDNAGEDPFTVRPHDLKGEVSKQIPYLGFPLLFFQSRQGLIFVIAALALLAIYLYADELTQGRRKAQKGIFSPIIREERRNERVMIQAMQSTEKKVELTEQALSKFASAIEEYAHHLQSHTSAIQGLSEASQELKKGAAEQNKVLVRLMEGMDSKNIAAKQDRPKVETIDPRMITQFPPGCIRQRKNPEKER